MGERIKTLVIQMQGELDFNPRFTIVLEDPVDRELIQKVVDLAAQKSLILRSLLNNELLVTAAILE